MQSLEVRVVERIAEIPAPAWDGLINGQGNPFVSWTFLEALERAGCASKERGWWPCHLTVWLEGELVAAAPAYIKADSAGDFSRDWGFAEVVQRAGISYYPKLVVGVPFSPVSGQRLLVHPHHDRAALGAVLLTLARELARENRLSSVHVLYHDPAEQAVLEDAAFCRRVLVQYHWKNRRYERLEDWLGTLRSKRRNTIRRERREPGRQGIVLETVRGEAIRAHPRRWAEEAFALYTRNCDKHFWGGTYLNLAFFQLLFERMPECVELVTASREGRIVAGALNLATASHLFGRYWGCREEHRFLHFNVCLYHSIDECIERGLRVFEGGAGGEHKLARGFEPTLVHCAHDFLNPEVQDLMGRYLRAEAGQLESQVMRWHEEQGLEPFDLAAGPGTNVIE